MTESLRIAGVNHRKASVEVRERLAVAHDRLPEALSIFRRCTGAEESLILSTCNRVEIYFAGGGTTDSIEALRKFIDEYHHMPSAEYGDSLYAYDGLNAARHLFHVVSGLDSMVVGETQILNQVKDAYLAAWQCRSTGRLLNQVFQKALNVGKMVHSRTSIHEQSVSVPGVAAKLAERIFANLSEKETLVIGAGEIGELAATALKHRGVKGFTICNRTLENAEAVARRVGGRALPLTAMEEQLAKSDIIVSCVGTETYVVTVEMGRKAARKRGGAPLFLIDLGVPRNIDPDVGRLENLYLFDVDDLQEIVDKNTVERDRAIEQCRGMIEAELEHFSRQFVRVGVVDVLTAVRERFHAVGEEEVRKTLEGMPSLGGREREEIAYLVRRVLNKVLHEPSASLREIREGDEEARVIEVLKKLFRL